MSRTLLFAILILSTVFVSLGSVFASPDGCSYSAGQTLVGMLKSCASGTVGVGAEQGTGVDGVKSLIVGISKTILSFGALFAVGAIVLSGIQYTTAYGDDEKIKKAKNTGIYALIGLILLVLAFPLVDIIITFIYSIAGA